MDIKIPFESKIKFKTSVYEISKVSLEHEFTINDGIILGNFLINGDYKTHEVSINKEEFNYTLPFQVDILDEVDEKSIELDIEDFTYDIINNETLSINIIYSVKGSTLEKEEVRFEEIPEIDFDDVIKDIDDNRVNVELNIINEIEKTEENNKKEETNEEVKTENLLNKTINSEDRDVAEETKNTIINNIKYDEDNYVTYHVHIVKENETVESISKNYNMNSIVINEYNDTTNLNVGDKLIIPFIDE